MSTTRIPWRTIEAALQDYFGVKDDRGHAIAEIETAECDSRYEPCDECGGTPVIELNLTDIAKARRRLS